MLTRPAALAALLGALPCAALAYDPRARRVVLIGGQASSAGPYLDDAWLWDGERWTEMTPPAGRRPAGRGGATLLHDGADGRLLYFGGYAERLLGDFWVLGPGGWREVVGR